MNSLIESIDCARRRMKCVRSNLGQRAERVKDGASAAGQHNAFQSVTREQVRAEVLAARAAGTLDITEAN
jgi:hypothetical protein